MRTVDERKPGNLIKLSRVLLELRGGMSLREVARKSGVSHAYIRDLELGVNRATNDKLVPSPDTLKKLSVAYNYSYRKLMELAGHMELEQPDYELYDMISNLTDDQREIVVGLIESWKGSCPLIGLGNSNIK